MEQDIPDGLITHRTMLATPKFLRSVKNLLRSSVNNPTEESTGESLINSEESYVYCGYLNEDTITIKKYNTYEIIDSDNLLIGPEENFNKITHDLLNYININNKGFEQISDFEYKLIDNDYLIVGDDIYG